MVFLLRSVLEILLDALDLFGREDSLALNARATTRRSRVSTRLLVNGTAKRSGSLPDADGVSRKRFNLVGGILERLGDANDGLEFECFPWTGDNENRLALFQRPPTPISDVSPDHFAEVHTKTREKDWPIAEDGAVSVVRFEKLFHFFEAGPAKRSPVFANLGENCFAEAIH
jgi:hypothetical protein